ncbi:MAG TPA: class I SAM-dependent methyltransferase [Thermoanaerobaculia bacterium]|nr:class I SAM-dependent methyltransferase [Thermoanaerobaculia bacterium]
MRSEAYGDFAWIYDAALGLPFSAASAPILESVLSSRPELRRLKSLDLACGTGLGTELLVRNGLSAAGVDASIPMLRQARDRGLRVVCGDLRDLPFRGEFGWITCLYDSLNHILSERDLLRVFREVRTLLASDGLFLFDVNQPEVYELIWSSTDSFQFDDDTASLEMRTSFSRRKKIGTAWIRGSASRNGRRIEVTEVRRQRAWSRPEIEGALDRSGLVVVERNDFDPFEQAGDTGVGIKWLYVCRKS